MKNNQVTLTKVTKLKTDLNEVEITEATKGLKINEESWEKVVLHRKSSKNKAKKKQQTITDKPFTTAHLFRKHEPLQRTSSAPIKIPLRHKGGERQGLERVNSVGVTRLSPGGTRRIMYNRDFLLECRQSPLSHTPPTDLPVIPGATVQSGKQRRAEKKLLEKMDSQRSNCSAVSTSSINQSTDDENL